VDRDEREEIARRFGVAPEQVERDHLISYLLAFLSANSLAGRFPSRWPQHQPKAKRQASADVIHATRCPRQDLNLRPTA
jgi:hypothetical protein